MFHENTMLQTENDKLRQRIKSMHETVEMLTKRNSDLLAEKAVLGVYNISGKFAFLFVITNFSKVIDITFYL